MTPQQLKASLLQEAIRGKLTDQRPEDGSAEDLYRAILAEKKRLIKAGKLKKENPLPPIEEKDIPFDIPENWKWVRLGEIFTLQAGKFISSSEIKPEGKPYLCYGGNGIRGYVDLHNREGNFPIIGRQGALCGNINYAEGVFYATEHAVTVDTYAGTNTYLVVHFLRALKLNQYATATAQPGLSVEKVNSVLFPLPPLAEQERIVAKLEDLLPLVERYGKAYTQLTALEQRFPASMRKSLLQEAIQGKLTDQRPEDGSAEDLYRSILAEKKRLIKAGKLKKEKPLPPIEEKDIPFDIPENWKWVRLGEITTYAQSKEKIEPSDISPETWSLDLEDIEKDSGRILVRNLAKERKITGSKNIFHKGELLYSKLRPYLKKILIAPEDGVCTPELVNFSAYNGISHSYLVQFLRSPYVDNLVNGKTYGVKMPRTNTETMCNLPVPLPPLAEQERIVAKLEELLPLCD